MSLFKNLFWLRRYSQPENEYNFRMGDESVATMRQLQHAFRAPNKLSTLSRCIVLAAVLEENSNDYGVVTVNRPDGTIFRIDLSA